MNKYGSINIKLKSLIDQRGISKNKICHRAEMQHKQLNKYCNNEITRFDADVLARLCTALDCEISDIIEFVPASEESSDNE